MDILPSLLDALPVLACYVDQQQVYRYVNRGYETWFGLDRAEFLGKSVRAVLGEDAYAVAQPQIDRALAGHDVRVELWMPYSMGSPRFVAQTFVPHRDELDQVVGFFGFVEDITVRHDTALKLERSEKELRTFFENSNCGKARIDFAARKLLVVNRRLAEMTGYSKTELLAMTAADLMPAACQLDYWQSVESNCEQRVDQWSHERILLDKTGHTLDVVMNESILRDRDGTPREVLSTILDVSMLKQEELKRKETEERFRTLADNIAQFAWMADGTGWIYWYNQRWFDYTGTTLEQMQGWGWQHVHHPEHVDRVVNKISYHFEIGETWEDTFPLRGQDGTYRWFLSRAKPIRDSSGKVIQWLGTNTDITDRLQMEEALRESDRRKDSFMAMLGHELRNPLAAIVGGVQLLAQQPAEQSLDRATLEVISRQAELMNRLVDDLLDVSRITRAKIQLRRQPTELGELVEQVVAGCGSAADEAGVACQIDHLDRPAIARIDRVRISQVVGNLLTNAIKFTPEGGTINVKLRRVPGESIAQITVRDSGVGMDAATLETVFQPFAQADASLDRSQGGLGLGLPIALGLVQGHGGQLTARSDGPDQGSTFEVRLPLCDPSEISLDELQPLDAPRPVKPAAIPPLSVVVIDDRRDSRFPVVRFLRSSGHEVAEAMDGREGLQVVTDAKPDLVVCDVGLPEMDGYEVARELQKDPSLASLKLLALTGYGQPRDREDALAAGFDEHLVKPVDFDELEQWMARTFASRGS